MAAARRSNQEGGEEEGEEVREEEVEEEEEEKEAVGGEEEWERVGPKNKSTVTRQVREGGRGKGGEGVRGGRGEEWEGAEPKITFEYWLVIVSGHVQFCPVKLNFDWPLHEHAGQCARACSLMLLVRTESALTIHLLL